MPDADLVVTEGTCTNYGRNREAETIKSPTEIFFALGKRKTRIPIKLKYGAEYNKLLDRENS